MRKMTEKAMNEAFAGESMANMKYLAFSEIAEREGLPNVARLFRAIAYAEQVHASNHARNLGVLKSTVDNLQTCIDGENFEVDEMYPVYKKTAEIQEEKGAERSCHYALQAEKIHHAMYIKAKETVQEGGDISLEDMYICPVCGYTHEGEPSKNCPICGVSRDKFKKF